MGNKKIKIESFFAPAPFTLTSKLPTPPPEGAPLGSRARPCGRARLVSPAPLGRGLGVGGLFPYFFKTTHILLQSYSAKITFCNV